MTSFSYLTAFRSPAAGILALGIASLPSLGSAQTLQDVLRTQEEQSAIYARASASSFSDSSARGASGSPLLPPPPPSMAPRTSTPNGLPAVKSDAPVTLNFMDTPIADVVRAYGVMLGKSVLVDPKIQGNVTITTDNPVRPAHALRLLSQVTRLRGWALTVNDHQILLGNEGDARVWDMPVKASKALDTPRPSKAVGLMTETIALQHETASNAVNILKPLIGPNQIITVAPQANAVVITDYAENMARTKKLLATIDVPTRGSFTVLTLQHALATDVAPMVAKLLDGTNSAVSPTQGQASGLNGQNTGRVIADPRTNVLMLQVPPGRLEDIQTLVRTVDNAAASTPGFLNVIHLKNAKAKPLAEMLVKSLAGLPKELVAGTITPDESTNSLVISASPDLFKQLSRTVASLDTPRAQVYVESLIAEVNAEDAMDMGIQWQGPIGRVGDRLLSLIGTNFGQNGNNILQLQSEAASTGTVSRLPGNGLNVGVGIQKDGVYFLGFLARFLEQNGKGNILSTPNLLTLDNEEAQIVIGQNVPFITGQFTNTNSGSNGAVNPFQTIERKDVGLTLKVTPQVSENNTVRLKIFQEVSNVVSTTINASAGPTTNKRAIDSSVVVEDGSIIVLGGLLQDQTSISQDKVPVLGDTPIVGNLFRTETKSRNKSNLMVFLRPVIIRNSQESHTFSIDRYDRMRSSLQHPVEQFGTGSTQNPPVIDLPVAPSPASATRPSAPTSLPYSPQ